MTANEDSDDSIYEDCIPPELLDEARKASENLLPDKSKEKYTAAYNLFKMWRKTKKTNSFDEAVLLVYFKEQEKILEPSTLWARYSMLRATIKLYDKIDISNYGSLSALLKKYSSGFRSKKSKVFTPEEVKKFIIEAPDNKYLATKIASIFRITGACRRHELCDMTTDDIDDRGNMLVVTIPKTKTNIQRSFTVIDEFYEIFKKYVALRPKNADTNRFFLNVRNEKCTKQVIGINKFGRMPKDIATYLKLREPQLYTGHSFRRTSATLLADSGADITTLKRHGGWTSDKVAEGYIEESVGNKKKICQRITGSIMSKESNENQTSGNINPTNTYKVNIQPSTSERLSGSTTTEEKPKSSTKILIPNKAFSLQLNNCSNFTIHYAQNKDQ